MSDIVRCKNFQCWNMSPSMLFGKSPKVKIICGKCGKYFSERFTMPNGNLKYPKTICPYCNTINEIPIKTI